MQDNNKDQSSDKEGVEQGWQTPGIALRKARRAQNLTEDEVCRELGLRIGVLKALESDDFERLPAAVYVRGYIRSYCSLLDIDELPVMDSYENYCQQVQGVQGCEGVDQPPAERPWWQQQKIWIVAVIVAVVVVIGLFVYL